MKSWVCGGLVIFLGAVGGILYSVLGAVGPRAAASPLALPLGMALASEAVDDMPQICLACFGFMEHSTSIWTNSPS